MTQTKPPSTIHHVGVVGAGQMGSGIAQVLACIPGVQVTLQDIAKSQLDRAQTGIEASLAKFVSKGSLSVETQTQALAQISTTTQLETFAKCDLVIEAIVEHEATKCTLFKTLDNILPPQALLASNTSSISITRLASATKRPGQVIGMHFMNPVPLMKLVELIRGAQTTPETVLTVRHLGELAGKTVVESADYPGFMSNRILMPMINEAIFALFEGVGSAADIDTVMKLGMNHPMGPLALADLIGLDTCLAILNVLYDGFKDSKYRPCPLLVQYVSAGYLGKKSGRGFYEYPAL